MAIVDVFTLYVGTRAILDQRAETIVRVLLGDLISIFGPIETLLRDGGPNLSVTVVRNLASILGIATL